LEAEQEQRADRRRRSWWKWLVSVALRSWWKWLVLAALLGLCAGGVVSALEGEEFRVIGFGAAAVLLCAVLIVFG
jgi:hypothetical protein